jgi:hypothetical protein
MSINAGSSHRQLPPAAPTSITGDVPLVEDFDADVDLTSAPENTAEGGAVGPQPSIDNKTPEALSKEAQEDDFDLPPDIKESLAEVAKLEKPLEKAKEEEAPKAETKPKAPEKVEETKVELQAGRNYDGLEPEVVAVLKQLRNGAYNAVKDQLPLWHKAFKTQGEMPKYIAQHPEAYKLDKQYQELEIGVHNAQFEASALYDGLMSLKQGKPFNLLTGYDKDGNPEYSKIDPSKGLDPRLEFEITEAYRKAAANQQSLVEQHKNYGSKYADKVRQERGFIEDSFKKIFKDIDPEKFTPEEAKYAPLLEKLIPDSVTPADARRIAHYAMIGNHRMGRMLQEYIKNSKGKALPAKPQPGATIAAGDVAIPLDDDAMFGTD